jgi:phosphohistidine phosphatase SixA
MSLETRNGGQNNLKSLYIVRHGEYGPNGSLSLVGRRQVLQISFKIANIINGETKAVYASPAKRTVETGNFLARMLKVQQVVEAALGLPEGQRNPQAILNILNDHRRQVQNLLLVTHVEVAEAFAKHLLNNIYEREMAPFQLETAEAWHITIEAGDMTHISARAK